MTLDPRDAILQAHTPVVIVPRHGELAPLARSGHRYLVAGSGLWLEVWRPWLRVVLPIAPLACWDDGWETGIEGAHAMPFGSLERRMAYGFGGADLDRIQTLFLHDARKAMPDEYAAWGVYDERSGALRYVPLIAEHASPGALVGLRRPALEAHEHLALDLHSHGAMEAYFSQTDDEDDAGEVKLSVVAGRLDTQPQWSTRLCLLGLFIGPESASST